MPPILVDERITFGTTLGAAYLGVVFSSLLYGLTCFQTFIYFQWYAKRDSWLIKGVALVMLILDTGHQGLIIYAGWYYFVQSWGNIFSFLTAIWSVSTSIFFNAFAGWIVEIFYIWRLYRFSHQNKWLSGVLLLCSNAALGAAIAWPIQLLQDDRTSRITKLDPTAFTGLGLSVLIDWIVAISLVYYLRQSRTSFRGTDTMINLLIQYTVSTGLLTSIITLLTLVTYAAIPQEFWFICFSTLITPLFANSILATLNTREHIREAAHPDTVRSIHMPKLAAKAEDADKSRKPEAARWSLVEVPINTAQISHSDNESSLATDLDDNTARPQKPGEIASVG